MKVWIVFGLGKLVRGNEVILCLPEKMARSLGSPRPVSEVLRGGERDFFTVAEVVDASDAPIPKLTRADHREKRDAEVTVLIMIAD